jgi:hypothetical protein
MGARRHVREFVHDHIEEVNAWVEVRWGGLELNLNLFIALSHTKLAATTKPWT